MAGDVRGSRISGQNVEVSPRPGPVGGGGLKGGKNEQRDDSEEPGEDPALPMSAGKSPRKGSHEKKNKRPEITNTKQQALGVQSLSRQLAGVHKHGNYGKENRGHPPRQSCLKQAEAQGRHRPSQQPAGLVQEASSGGGVKRGRNRLCLWCGFCKLPKPGAPGGKEVVSESSKARPDKEQWPQNGALRGDVPGPREHRRK